MLWKPVTIFAACLLVSCTFGRQAEDGGRRFIFDFLGPFNPFWQAEVLLNLYGKAFEAYGTFMAQTWNLSQIEAAVMINITCAVCICNNTCYPPNIINHEQCQRAWNTSDCPTTHAIPLPGVCNKYCAVGTIAKGHKVSHDNASTCVKTGSQTTNEALVLSCCNVTDEGTWVPVSANVMSSCKSTKNAYKPIGKFIGGNYVPGSSAVFLDCTEGNEFGFKMVFQDCNTDPSIIHVVHGGKAGFTDPEHYYFI